MADKPVTSPAISNAEVVKALMQEYISARQEVLLHVQLYKTQERNGAILISLVGLAIPLLIGQSISPTALGIWLSSTHWTGLLILFLISTIVFFMFYSALAVLFALQVQAERCVWPEDEINKYLPEPYFVWEGRITKVTRAFWAKKSGIVLKMPDFSVLILSYLLVIFVAVFLPLLGVTKILCEGPDLWLKASVFLYTGYLFIVLPFGVYINNYVMGALRDDCCQLFAHAVKGDVPPLPRSGIGTLLVIVVAASAVAGVFITFIPHPTVCTYIGPRSPSPPSAPAAGQTHTTAPWH